MKLINLHTHKQTKGNNSLEIFNANFKSDTQPAFYSLGIHPWYIEVDKVSEQLAQIKMHLSEPNCLAIGECGLDKNIAIDLSFQKEVFIQQLELNKQFNKPVIIHCVKAFQEIILIRKKYAFPFIIHGFNKKIELANQLLKNDFYLSFGKALLSNEKLQAVFKEIPLDKFFLETDDSEFSIIEIYKKAAQVKEISLNELTLRIENNYDNLKN